MIPSNTQRIVISEKEKAEYRLTPNCVRHFQAQQGHLQRQEHGPKVHNIMPDLSYHKSSNYFEEIAKNIKKVVRPTMIGNPFEQRFLNG